MKDYKSVAFYATKGGQGTTVTTAVAALALGDAGHKVTAVDLTGDLAATFGLAATAPGENRGVTDNVVLAIPNVDWPIEDLSGFAHDGMVLADFGQYRYIPRIYRPAFHTAVTRFQVVRGPDYVGMLNATKTDLRDPDKVFLVTEPDRALGVRDVETVTGAPVVSTDLDPAVARTVDAGLLTTRLPRDLERAVLRLFS